MAGCLFDCFWADAADLGYAFRGANGEVFECWVDHTGIEGVFSCGEDQPMRVCAPGALGDAPIDSEGNPVADAFDDFCNWIDCGWTAYPPTDYFGGCSGNGSAGTLCCR